MTTALRVFLPFALTYLTAYAMRSVNAVAGESISAELNLTSADLGFLTSVYLAGFALCQLPFGVLLDRYGPRRVEAATLMISAGGCAIFAVASGLSELVVGRVMMGVGSALVLMAPFTAYRKWFSPERLPFVVGCMMVFGASGSALAGRPAEALMMAIGWRGLFVMFAIVTCVAAASILFVVPARREPPKGQSMAALTRELGTVLKSRALYRLGPLSAVSQAGYLSVVGLWAGPWLRDVAGLSPAAAATWLSATGAGLMIGFFSYGALASRAARVGRTLDVFVGGTILFTILLAIMIVLPPWAATPLWVLMAGLSSGGILTYALLSSAFDESLAGRVNTTLNFLVFFVAFLVQWLYGVVLEWGVGAGGDALRWGHQLGLIMLLVLQLLAYVPLVLLKPDSNNAPSTESA